jgi:hypothetical protein
MENYQDIFSWFRGFEIGWRIKIIRPKEMIFALELSRMVLKLLQSDALKEYYGATNKYLTSRYTKLNARSCFVFRGDTFGIW